MELRKQNDACIHDPFSTSFIDEVLENVGRQEAYSFMNGFSGYHQIKIVPEDRSKMSFPIEWDWLKYKIMLFGLKNVLTIFSCIVVTAFK